MTTTIVYLVVAFIAGMGLGLFYFGSLWLTVRAVQTARRAVLLTLSSFVGRMAVTIVGFYLIMGGHWERLIVALLGFLLMRGILVRRLGKKGKISDFLRKEV
jgi:F1F0 ATPase subunit 2